MLQADDNMSVEIKASIKERLNKSGVDDNLIAQANNAAIGDSFDPEDPNRDDRLATGKKWWQKGKRLHDKPIKKHVDQLLNKPSPEEDPPPRSGSVPGEKVRDETGNTSMNSHLDFRIESLGSGSEQICSRVHDVDGFQVIINSDNIKFKTFESNSDAMLLLLYISELIIREVVLYTTPTSSKDELDVKISSYFEDNYTLLKENVVPHI